MPKPNFLRPGQDRVNQDLSPRNRQVLPYELPVAAFMRATARIQERHDKARHQQKMNGIGVTKGETWGEDKWEAEHRDYQVISHYRHHFTDMRGAGTVKRENMVVKK